MSFGAKGVEIMAETRIIKIVVIDTSKQFRARQLLT